MLVWIAIARANVLEKRVISSLENEVHSKTPIFPSGAAEAILSEVFIPGVSPEREPTPYWGSREYEVDESATLEVDGILFQTLVPERVWEIPDQESGDRQLVGIGVRITNQTQETLYLPPWIGFLHVAAILEGSHETSATSVSGGGEGFMRGIPQFPTQTYCQMVRSGEELIFFPRAFLYWHDDQLFFGGSDLGGFWADVLSGPGTYSVSIGYKNSKSAIFCFNPEQGQNQPLIKYGFWTGYVRTPPIQIEIIQSNEEDF